MISVITPTYNRGYILGKLKDSLERQTSHDFEWLIIDDGSSDNTKELVKKWMLEDSSICIRYFCHENGGKHRALNYGIPLAKGDYVFIVDSDDHLTDDSILLINQWIDTIKDKEDIAGVAGLRGYPDGKRIGDYPKKKTYVDVKNSHRYTNHLTGDKAEIYKKTILVEHPFPEIEGEKFIGEGAVWNQLSLEGYKLRWFNQIIYVCDYLEDGLTCNAELLNKSNFRGYTHNTKLNYKSIVYPYNLMAVAVYIGVAKNLGYSLKWVKETIGLSMIDLLICKLIRIFRRMS